MLAKKTIVPLMPESLVTCPVRSDSKRKVAKPHIKSYVSSLDRQDETASKLARDRESCYGRWGYPGVARTLYVRVANRQEARVENILQTGRLCQRLMTSCAPAYAGAPGGYCLRATQSGTITTTFGILRHFQMPVPPLKTCALGDAPNAGAPLAAPSAGRASPAPTRRRIAIDPVPCAYVAILVPSCTKPSRSGGAFSPDRAPRS